MSIAFQQALAELRPEDVSFILSQLPPMETPVPEHSVSGNAGSIQPEDEEENRRRRHIEREWPGVGATLSAEYYGEHYTAEIIPATKRLKSGKQIRIASGPSRGALCDSFSEAMLSATECQRATQNLARKGVSNGWLFWQWDGKPDNIAGDDSDDTE